MSRESTAMLMARTDLELMDDYQESARLGDEHYTQKYQNKRKEITRMLALGYEAKWQGWKPPKPERSRIRGKHG